jgi:hypothetical protein
MVSETSGQQENLGAILGVIVVCIALVALGVMTSYMVSAVGSDDAKLAIGTTALGVIGTVIGAFFGVKVASDSNKNAQAQTQDATKKLVALAHASDPNDPNVKAALDL